MEKFVSTDTVITPVPNVVDVGFVLPKEPNLERMPVTDVGWPVTDGGWPTGVTAALAIGGTMMASVGLYVYNKWISHQKEKQHQQGQAIGETRLEQLFEERNVIKNTRLEQLFKERDRMAQQAEEMDTKIRNEYEAEIQQRDNVIKELANKLEIALSQGEKAKNLLAEANRRDKTLGEYFKAMETELLLKHSQTDDLLKEQQNWKREKKELEDQIEAQGKEMEHFLAEAGRRDKQLGALEEDIMIKNRQIEDLSCEKQNWKCEKEELEHQIEVALHHGEEMENCYETEKARADKIELCLILREYETKVKDSLAVEVQKRDEKIEEMANQLEAALHHGKEMENLVGKQKARANHMDKYLITFQENEKKLRDRFALEVKNKDKKTQEMSNKLEAALHHGKEMENLVEKQKATANEMNRYLTSLQEYEKKLRDQFAMEVKNRDEKIQEMSNKLEAALHHGKEMENLVEKQKATANEMDRYLTSLQEYEKKLRDQFAMEVKNRDEKIQEMSNKLKDALHHGKKMENLLKTEKTKADEKGRYLSSLREYKTKL
ncbi:golgin subfamily A member 6-like protein 24 [Macrobrachium rosenbergii]|uniref:golgin subfamily A member 6-like protein 24 n=1 Tax=Macrobrachium rosenbergii TaxID=79674 RepID=UPI0034D7A0DA